MNNEQNAPKRQLTSVVEWLDWLALQLDALMGKWELQVKIEDIDLINAGAQPFYLEVPNLAEAQKILITKGIESTIQNELIINLLGRVLFELANVRQVLIESASKVEAIEDYMGIPTTVRRVEVPFSVSLQSDFDAQKKPYFRQLSLEEFLKVGTLVVRVSQFEEEFQDMATPAADTLGQGARGVFQ